MIPSDIEIREGSFQPCRFMSIAVESVEAGSRLSCSGRPTSCWCVAPSARERTWSGSFPVSRRQRRLIRPAGANAPRSPAVASAEPETALAVASRKPRPVTGIREPFGIQCRNSSSGETYVVGSTSTDRRSDRMDRIESLGTAETRGAYLNVVFVRDRRSQEESPGPSPLNGSSSLPHAFAVSGGRARTRSRHPEGAGRSARPFVVQSPRGARRQSFRYFLISCRRKTTWTSWVTICAPPGTAPGSPPRRSSR